MTERKIDSVYDFVDKNCSLGNFAIIDLALTKLRVDKMGIDAILTWLTTTNWCKSELNNREDFCNKVLSQQNRLEFTEKFLGRLK